MDINATSTLIQDWYVLNDDRWAALLPVSRVRVPQAYDADTLPSAA
jgi:hypothetical protein